MKSALLIAPLAPLLAAGALLSAKEPLPGYRLAGRFPVGGEGTYDYIRYDAPSDRIYASHQTRVEVLDARTGRIVGSIADLRGVHGIALDHRDGRGFASNGLDGTITVFDPASLRILATIRTAGKKPDAIEYDAASGWVVVSNGHSNDLTILAADTGRIARTVPLAGNPESIVFDGRGRAFVNVESRDAVARVDLASGRIEAEWAVAPGEGPTGLALDRERSRLFASCGGNRRLLVLDAADGRRICELPVGDDSDAVGYDPSRRRVFSSNRDGTLTVIQQDDADRYRVAGTVATQFGAKTLALDPARDRVYLPVARFAAGPENRPGPVVPGTFEILVVSE